MECIFCNHTLGEGNFCPSCGRDITRYRKIVRTSNAYYNIGLDKCAVRDLSGASVYLKKALDLNKRNTDARNLLGLVYFEMGEVVDALAEWVISKNLQPENNLAADYLKKLQSRQTRLKAIDQTLKKFNQALYYAKTGSDDLAILQAKRVIGMNSRFIKAYQLLGLLYMKKGEYAKAEKPLKAVLSIDTNNTLALSYLEEMKALAKENKVNLPRKITKDTRRVVSAEEVIGEGRRDEVIVPTYHEGLGSWATLAILVTGVIVGVLFTFFLILPVKERNISSEYNNTILSYNEKISERDTNIGSLQGTISGLEDEKAQLETALSAYTNEGGIITEYNKLLMVLKQRANGQFIEAMESILTVNPDVVADETFKNVYNELKNDFDVNAVANLYAMGKAQYDAHNWAQAEVYFRKALELQPDYPEVIFLVGHCRQGQGDWPGAVGFYNMLIDNPAYTGTIWGQTARAQRGY